MLFRMVKPVIHFMFAVKKTTKTKNFVKSNDSFFESFAETSREAILFFLEITLHKPEATRFFAESIIFKDEMTLVRHVSVHKP